MINNTVTKLFAALSFVVLFGSCASYKQVALFQNVPNTDSMYSNGMLVEKSHYDDLKIRTGDILQVTVQTKIPATQSLGKLSEGFVDPKGFTLSDWKAVGRVGNPTPNRSLVPSYMVDSLGNIDLPLVGKVAVKGQTIAEIKNRVRKKVTQYYKEPIVSVRLANFKVTILGEVKQPGTYVMGEGKTNILDALAMAGDMTIYGKRTNVLLSREVDDGERMVRFNMDSTGIFNSPYFYLKQGDVIYVEPTKGRARANDAFNLRIYSLAASSLSIIVSIITRIF